MATINTGLFYTKRGRHYPIVADGGMFYIVDPRHELTTERASVARTLSPRNPARANFNLRQPGLGRYIRKDPRARSRGLGLANDQVQAITQTASTVASQIPVVGPYLQAAIQVAGAIFGGGDPTALSVLIGNIVTLRAQIAQYNNALGQADTFTVPAGFDPADKDKWRDLVDGIVEQVLGVAEPAIQSDRRKDYYATIAKLQPIVQQLAQQAHDKQLTVSILGASGAPGTATAAGASSGSNIGLLALVGLGAILLSRR